MAYKIFVCSEFPDISDKASRKTKRRRTYANTKRYVLQAKAVTYYWVLFDYTGNTDKTVQ